MKYLKFTVTPHWGLLINLHGFTKSRPVIPTVPPTTILGALTYPLSFETRWSENLNEYSGAERLRRTVRGVYISQDICITEYSDLSKIFSYDKREKNLISDAVAVGKLYVGPKAGRSKLDVILMIDEDEMKLLLGKEWESILKTSAWSICRLGARESIVSVENVELDKAIISKKKEIHTKYYFPAEAAKVLSGDYFITNVVDWRKQPIGDYVSAPVVPLVVPYSREKKTVTELRVRIMDESAYDVGGETLVPWPLPQ